MASAIEEMMDQVSDNRWRWYVKRLSANDSGATNSHQAGVYVPKHFLWQLFPDMAKPERRNPDAWFSAEIKSCNEKRSLRAVWYNDKTRNESRITQWNRPARVLQPDQTGAIILLAFLIETSGANATDAMIWICQSEKEEIAVENRIGLIEPGEGILYSPAGGNSSAEDITPRSDKKSCIIDTSDIPAEWRIKFPSGQTLVEAALNMCPAKNDSPDNRLLIRRDCETALFYSVEKAEQEDHWNFT